MDEEQKKKVGNLFDEIERLKDNTKTLAERTTENAKVAEVSRELLRLNDKKSIIDFTLKRFSLIENFPYVSFCKVSSNNDAKIIAEYSSLPGEGRMLKDFHIDKTLLKKLFSAEGIFIRKILDGDSEIIIKFNNENFKPAYCLAVAVDFKEPKEFFFLVTSKDDLARLRKKMIAVQSALDLIRLRIDNIRLNESLRKHNEYLKEKVGKKTKEQEESLLLNNVLLETSPEAIILHDKGNVVYANKAAVNLLKTTEEEILKKNILFLVPEEEREKVQQRMKSVVEKGEVAPFRETKILTFQGKALYVEIEGHPVTRNGKVIICLFIRDVTERRKSEELMILARKKAEAADKLKTEFIAQVSHEMRTPLNIIINYLALLEEELDEEFKEQHKLEIETIKNGSKRLERTVDLILSLTEMELDYYSPQIREFDVYADVLFTIYYGKKESALKKGLKIKLLKNTDNTLLKSDFTAVTKIAENLIDNAIKFTNEGKVKINVGRDEVDRLYVEVTDTGIGISKEFIRKMFAPFSQESQGSTRQYQGMGLGLTLVKKYCEIINAEVNVNTQKEGGTTFKVTFNPLEA